METSIAMGEFTEAAFLAVCERQNTTPERVFERAAVARAKQHGLELAAELRAAGLGR